MLAAAGAQPARAEVAGSWQPTGAPLSSEFETAATLANGRVLVVYVVREVESEEFAPGEHVEFGEHRHLASEFYEPGSRAWMPGPNPPGEAASSAVALVDGGALLFGETACEITPPDVPQRICSPTSSVYELGANDSEWTSAATMHVARTRPVVVRLPDGRVLVAGGFGDPCLPTVAFGYSCPALSSAEVFNPTTGTWSLASPMPTARGGAAATVLSNGTVLLVGGSNSTEDILRYDPAADRWSTLAAPPVPLIGATLLPLPGERAIALGSEPYADFEGSLGTADTRALYTCHSIPEIYSPAHNTWTPAPPLPGTPISCASDAILLPDGQVLTENALLDFHQDCWAPAGAHGSQVHGNLVPLLDGEALAFGEDGGASSAETYTPGVAKCTLAQQARANLFVNMAPQGAEATPATILDGGYRFTVQTPTRGIVRINWYSTVETVEGPTRVLIADANVRSPGGRPVEMTVKLTAKGTEVLEDEMSVTAEGTFTAKGAIPVTVAVTRAFKLQTDPRR
ncbi:MAG TPA: kelch repeat-containing protein [Solirubrobacteraceae bacterium]|nr:kelch repeat-containing protein [Solirubrobacteraceae bacterium]